jgi:NADH:ubiquinone oxidoreductase subunit 5 (subunit L)/multisubunit Na+/H+ antiporter MnhA subunit
MFNEISRSSSKVARDAMWSSAYGMLMLLAGIFGIVQQKRLGWFFAVAGIVWLLLAFKSYRQGQQQAASAQSDQPPSTTLDTATRNELNDGQ